MEGKIILFAVVIFGIVSLFNKFFNRQSVFCPTWRKSAQGMSVRGTEGADYKGLRHARAAGGL